ncbi:MAG: tetratricopeptide repeat protein [Candidatus Aminicenantales bacterium]
MKKAILAAIVLFGTWACATFTPAPPSFDIADIPQSVSTRLTLDQRIAADQAWADLKAGKVDQARKELLKLGEDNPLYAVGLGYANLYLADRDGAEASFRESLRRFPDLTLANAGLAQLYESRGQKALALSNYREILKRDPENRWARPRFDKLRDELVGQSLADARGVAAAGSREEAKKAFLKVLSYAPESAEANLELARAYRTEKNAGQAIIYYKAAVSAQPANKAALRELADLLYEMGEFGQSLDYYEKLAELEPQNKTVADRVEELKGKLGVFELPSQYGLIPAQEAITREDLAALIAVKFKDFLNVPERQTQILVDISTSWAQKFIIKVASLSVMNVFDNHTFQPRRIINRAELAESVIRLIDFLKERGSRFVPLLDVRKIQITDVSPDSFYYQPILKAVAYQVMDLKPQRTFEPEKTVPGRDAAKVLDIVQGLAR